MHQHWIFCCEFTAIMAFILFCLKAMNKVMSFGSKPEEPAQPTTKICPFCMSERSIFSNKDVLIVHLCSQRAKQIRNRKEYKMKVTVYMDRVIKALR